MAHKDKRGNTASFIKLDTWIFERPAYRRLGLGARCLHMELIRVYNGYNNGRLFLSHRLAADRLGCSRNTVSRYYRELEEAGFIVKTRGACLGPDGIGQATHWALTHLGVDGRPATLDFKS
ncbi:MAG: helix-turn-helix domain-containing protein [Maritimibacter sp.]|jgi:biotin operon repressor